MLLSETTQTTTTLAGLNEVLHQLPTDDGEVTRLRNLALMKRIGAPVNVLRLLDGVVLDRRALSEIAARSYRHINHFDKIVLVDTGAELGYRLTLHLWQPPYSDSQHQDELIHDHRFSFWSNILTGTLKTENFAPAEEGERFLQYQYTPEKRELTTYENFYDFVGQGTLRRTEPSTKYAGESYFLDYRSTHRVILPKVETTCTLVLRGPRRRRFSNVFNTTYPDRDLSTGNTPFRPDEVECKLRLLATLIRGTQNAHFARTSPAE